MSKLRLVTLIGLCIALIPAFASAGEPTGSCYSEFADGPQTSTPLFPDGKGLLAYCADDVTENDCDKFSGGSAEWDDEVACLEIDIPFEDWDGTCLLGDIGVFQGVCLFLYVDPQSQITSQEVCEGKGAGTWSDDLGCGFPVPATPRVALAGMALLLLAISLAILSTRSSGF